MVRQQISIILLGTLLVLTVSCASLQKDTLASTVDDGLSGDIADIAASIVPLDTSAGFAQVLDARKTIRDLEQKEIKDTVFEATLLAWSGRLFLVEGKRPEALRALRRAQTLAPGVTAVAVLEARLKSSAEERLAFLDSFRDLADTPAVIEIERARTLGELRRYREAVAAWDAAFPALPTYYRETYGSEREQAWTLRSISPDSSASSDALAAKPEITLTDALTLIRDETTLLANITGGSLWTTDRLYRDLNNRGIIPVDSLGTVRLQDRITRAHAAWILWQLNAEHRAQPGLKTRYSDRIRTLPNPKSPVLDVPHGSRWFDSVMGCVEWEFMNLPDGKNFFPDRPIPGIAFMEMLRRVN
ncbi:MAG TPA: hypothetical protein P5286_08885 [Treponemataceae bacterium]|nr:hypothetical protein [Treponemataceae bacterium]